MQNTYQAAVNYEDDATYFLRMVRTHGGVKAARRLLNTNHQRSRLANFWELGRFDISAEALLLEERDPALFTDDERREAQAGIRDYEYELSTP